MKTYIQPAIEVIDMATSEVIASSLVISETSTEMNLESRKRSQDWSSFEE
jgi:hypothetical protein